jgi:mono/diheme cytochrome c family protein
MKRILVLGLFVCVVALTVYGVLTLYDETLQVGRMWETPAIRPHEAPLPVMAAGTVPFSGGEELYRTAASGTLEPPFALNDPAVISQGQQGYQYFCIHCHGRYFDGMGTVGQSFSPLPGDLRSVKVQQMDGDRLFREISYGIPGGRQPALDTTIDVNDRWRIISYIKSLGVRP